MNITFTIKGNQENPQGNPIPYERMTQGAFWRKDAKRYHEWKDYVRAAFIAALYEQDPNAATHAARLIATQTKPLTTAITAPARMDLKIFWRNHAHADPDNIWKGIADALFVNDKNLDGSFESQQAADGKGKVEVSIFINQNKT